MLTDIKKMMGITNDNFDSIIRDYISSAKQDLIEVGIAESNVNENDPLVKTAIISYVLSFLDVDKSELFANSYNLQKDKLRHIGSYKEGKE